MTEHDIPQGIKDDAASTWPPKELIDSFLGNFDFEFRPGEELEIGDDEEAQAAARRFRDTLGRYCSGVTVVTSMSDGAPVGMTCQSFSSVSLDPPLVTFIPTKTSRAWPLMQRSGHFAVNILAADQVDISNRMASRGADKFADTEWTLSKTGSPLLAGTVGYVDCTVHAVHDAGDHWIVVGRVQDMDFVVDDEGLSPDPLLYFQGKYRTTR
ncbi:flavin reductase family protein [Nocardioides alcanivorans]|uniref:flavin reductase family protein n=1 Tax=Nocardioides alcanivorans TaxID=2897352 RepID=UPI001F4697EA|nr:flavin reductase family protein [Nocardioides alcanivorans]